MSHHQPNFKFLIQHTPAAVAMFDRDMHYIAHSDRWLQDYHLEGQEIIGKSHYEVFPDILDRWKEDHQRVLNGEVYVNTEDEWIRDNGSVVYIKYELRPWRDAQALIQGIVMFTEVITDTVLIRKKLEKSNAELQRVNEQLSGKNKVLKQFTYITSHDLQEPLRTIQSYSNYLVENYQNSLDDIGNASLAFISGATTRMTSLIKSLLDYSRIGNNPLLASIDVNQLVQEVLTDLNSSIQEHEITIQITTLPRVSAFQIELRMLFQNLLSNAIKYRKKDLPLTVEIAAIEYEYVWEFRVSDNGIGIAPKHHDRIFQVFQRLHSQEIYEGTGIGLAHCKKIVDLHGGNLWVNSILDQGSTFHFSIDKSLKACGALSS